ncbi:unnamed protein product [Bemisia tabaci]|uniref:DUF5641 domain-containing protein n=1 Tax=Bemisia tabaci TaxID=7038 RepID=A0A9P0A4P6_BEMTA|nr:unnamed protein product [Bemisia tabaci]
MPEYDWSKEPKNRLSRWQLLQAITQEFWRRWSLEYLNTLQQRQKWLTDTRPIGVGDVVLIREDGYPPLHWPLGRVTAVHPGADSVVRVVTVQRANGRQFKRAAVKLCRLPVDP